MVEKILYRSNPPNQSGHFTLRCCIINVRHGAVQGSSIGPLMFLLYISELIGIIESHGIKVKVFADNVSFYLQIVNDVDFIEVQNALDSLHSWANMRQLPISVDKC